MLLWAGGSSCSSWYSWHYPSASTSWAKQAVYNNITRCYMSHERYMMITLKSPESHMVITLTSPEPSSGAAGWARSWGAYQSRGGDWCKLETSHTLPQRSHLGRRGCRWGPRPSAAGPPWSGGDEAAGCSERPAYHHPLGQPQNLHSTVCTMKMLEGCKTAPWIIHCHLLLIYVKQTPE